MVEEVPVRRGEGERSTSCSIARARTAPGAPRVTPGWPCELVAQLQVRYPSVPIVFADSRKLAEDWTHRYLAAAAALHGDADA